MNRCFALAVMLTALAAPVAAAQQPADTSASATAAEVAERSEPEVLGVPVGSAGSQDAGELEAALERLAGRLEVLTDRIANDPELRASAVRTAEGLLQVTELLVATQSELLLDVLRKASEEISATAGRSAPAAAVERDGPTG